MTFIELLIIALSLSMDAFAVTITQSLSQNLTRKKMLAILLSFSFFQAFMPFIGYYFGNYFSNYIKAFDHWIAFAILSFIGFKMIKDAIINDNKLQSYLNIKTLLLLSIATSIDALIMGITFSLLKINIFYCISIIGLTTFIICFIGLKIGKYFKETSSTKYQIIGGVMLFIIGLKILFEHLILI